MTNWFPGIHDWLPTRFDLMQRDRTKSRSYQNKGHNEKVVAQRRAKNKARRKARRR